MTWYPGRTVVKIKGTHKPLKQEGHIQEICLVCGGSGWVKNQRAFPGCEEGQLRRCVMCKDGKV